MNWFKWTTTIPFSSHENELTTTTTSSRLISLYSDLSRWMMWPWSMMIGAEATDVVRGGRRELEDDVQGYSFSTKVFVGIFVTVCATAITYVATYRMTQKRFRRTMDRLFHWKRLAADTNGNDKDPSMPFAFDAFFILPLALGPPIPITRIIVKKEFTSKTKPLLVSFSFYGRFERHYIYKKEDVTNDWIVQKSFAFLNERWKGTKWFVPTYRVLPLNSRSGIVEVVKGTKNSAVLEEAHLKREKCLPSLVGGIVGCFVLGVRDRHFDNVLIRSDDGAFVHIDFGHILRTKSLMLGTRIAIPPIVFKDERRKNLIRQEAWEAYRLAIAVDQGTRFKRFIRTCIHELKPFIEETPSKTVTNDEQRRSSPSPPPVPPPRTSSSRSFSCESDGQTTSTRHSSQDSTSPPVDAKRSRKSSWFHLSSQQRGTTEERETDEDDDVPYYWYEESDPRFKLRERANAYLSSGCLGLSEKAFKNHVKVFAKMRIKNFFHKLAHGSGDHM